MTLSLLLAVAGCTPSGDGHPTYYADAKPILDARCATCHQDGAIGPFPLTTYEEVYRTRAISRMAIESGAMPPFMPSHECNDYASDFDLTPAERDVLLAFFDADAPEGDAADDVSPGIPDSTLDADLVLSLPEPYTPTLEPDDYRCQLVDPGLTEATYVTGFQVWPDQRAVVHHNITFVVGASQRALYEAFDDADPGPGWTCFGGPSGVVEDVEPPTLEELLALLDDPEALAQRTGGTRTVGSWVPGAVQGELAPGTGIRLEPGDLFVVQMHYNTLSSAPVADQSQIALTLAPEVDYPAIGLPLLDLAWPTGLEALGTPMHIAAGDPAARASVLIEGGSAWMTAFRDRLGAGPDDPIRIHSAGVHMHELGTDGRIDILRAAGDAECAIHYPAWDFSWQGAHRLAEPIVLQPEDSVRLTCEWDNTAANQPIINGEPATPQDVSWGEGTQDEMCLGNFYITL